MRRLLVKAGYIPIKPDDVYIRKSDGKVRGRGYWHDTDALGRFSYPLLYMYPIRLLAEAKCYKDAVPIPDVRNFCRCTQRYFRKLLRGRQDKSRRNASL